MEKYTMQAGTQTIHLSEYWDVIVKRKELVLGVLAVVVAATLVLSLLMKPVYKATARLAVERESTSSPITGQRTDYIDVQSQLLTFNTHFKLIKSRPVLESVLQALSLEGEELEPVVSNPLQIVINSLQESIMRIGNNVKSFFFTNSAGLTEQERLEKEINELLEQVAVSHVRETRLVNVDVADTDPQKAARIANLLAEKYIEFDLGTRLESQNQNMEWLTREVYEMKKRLEDDERAFYDYKQQNRVFSLEGKQRVIDQKISDLNNKFVLTRSKRQEVEAKLAEIERQTKGRKSVGHIRSILDNKSIDDIYANLTSLELELSRLSKVFKKKHPKIIQASTEVAKVRAKFKNELNKEIDNLKVRKAVLLSQEQVMEQTIAEYENEALNTGSKELKYTILQRNMDTSQQLYETLVAKIKEVGVVTGATVSNIRVVEHAFPPIDPVKPNKIKNVLLALVLGLFGGVGLAFFLEYIDQSIRTEEDIKKLLDLPVLAVVPIADDTDRGAYY